MDEHRVRCVGKRIGPGAAWRGRLSPRRRRVGTVAGWRWPECSVDGGQVSWRDEAAPERTAADPVQLDVHALRATVNDLSWPVAATRRRGGAAPVPRSQTRRPTAHSAARAAAALIVEGRVVAAPLAVRGALRIERFPVHALERYASGGAQRQHAARGQLQLRGDVALRQRGRRPRGQSGR